MISPGKIRQILALVIIAATVALAGAIAMKAYRGMRSERMLPSLPKNIEVSLQKIHYTETKDGVKKWDLVADTAEFDKVDEVARLSGIRLEVAGSQQTGMIVLTSERGEYDTRNKKVELVGNVVARSASGMTLETTRAAYLSDRSMIRSNDRVKFSDGNLKLEGVGLEFMVETKRLKLARDVSATFTPGDRKR